MMLVTTSRKPGQQTRSVARTIAKALGAEFLNRGKSGVDSVLNEADKLAASKVLFVWERHGNPSRLIVLDVEKAAAGDEKAWLEPELWIKAANFKRIPVRRAGATIVAADDFGKKIKGLFEAKEGPNQILLSRSGLKITSNDELLLELRF